MKNEFDMTSAVSSYCVDDASLLVQLFRIKQRPWQMVDTLGDWFFFDNDKLFFIIPKIFSFELEEYIDYKEQNI